MSSQADPDLRRFLADLSGHVDGVRDGDKALKIGLRLAREHFRADEACIALARPGGGPAEIGFRVPPGADWRSVPFDDFLAGRRPRLPRELIVAPLRRQGRTWGLVGLRRAQGFERPAVRAMGRFGERLSELLGQIDRVRIAEVQARIDRKLLQKLRPQDLFYQILSGLKTLVRYDHSAALHIHDEECGVLELVAEKVAWRKGKSHRIGRKVVVGAEVAALLEAGEVLGFDRAEDGWRPWLGRDSEGLACLLDPDGSGDGPEDGAPPQGSILLAPLATREEVLGVLEVASRGPGSLNPYQAELVGRFLPHAAVAIRNLRRTAAMEERMLAAEKQHAMANLARGVSHDINNAFGAALPLVQQIIADLQDGAPDPAELVQDLAQIESSLQTCRRIFGGMLSFARGAERGLGQGDLRRAVEATLAILADSMRRRGVTVEAAVDELLPAVRGGQGDLEQLVLNLLTNARDAMPGGGTLGIHAARDDEAHVRLDVTDTGVGIPPEDFGRIEEPFFTTKRHGSGLGLSICRSIVWEVEGRITFESQPGEGTRVTVRVPLAEGAEP